MLAFGFEIRRKHGD